MKFTDADYDVFKEHMGDAWVKRVMNPIQNGGNWTNAGGCPCQGHYFTTEGIDTPEKISAWVQNQMNPIIRTIKDRKNQKFSDSDMPMIKKPERDIITVHKIGDVIRSGEDLAQVLYKTYPTKKIPGANKTKGGWKVWAKNRRSEKINEEFIDGTFPPDAVDILGVPERTLCERDRQNLPTFSLSTKHFARRQSATQTLPRPGTESRIIPAIPLTHKSVRNGVAHGKHSTQPKRHARLS